MNLIQYNCAKMTRIPNATPKNPRKNKLNKQKKTNKYNHKKQQKPPQAKLQRKSPLKFHHNKEQVRSQACRYQHESKTAKKKKRTLTLTI